MVIKLWDGFIRSFHWLLVLAIAGLWYTGGNIDYIDLHHRLGVFVLALILTRILWGIFGSESGRFSRFVRSPKAVVDYLKAPFASTWLTHNPIGGWAVILMLAALFAQAVSGLFTDDAIFFRGPLAHLVSQDWVRTLTSFHKQLFDWILVLLALHILANIVYAVRGKNLITPMITGNLKTEKNDLTPPKQVHPGFGFILFAINVTVLFWWLT